MRMWNFSNFSCIAERVLLMFRKIFDFFFPHFSFAFRARCLPIFRYRIFIFAASIVSNDMTHGHAHIKSNKRLLKFYVRVFSVAIPFYGFFRCKVKYFHHLSAFVCFRSFVLSFLRLFTEKMCSPSGPKYF